MIKLWFLILLLFSTHALHAQCDSPPTLSGGSSIVSSNDGAIYIDGQPCDQNGQSSNYDCSDYDLTGNLIIQDGDCLWEVTNGDWGTIAPLELPIVLKTFQATCFKGVTEVLWETDEINVDYYILQYSYDGGDWGDCAKIYTNNQTRYIYSRIDAYCITYYRLLSIDTDGTIDTHHTIVNICPDKIQVFPNPAFDEIILRLCNFYECYIEIYNNNGQFVLMQDITNPISAIDISTLSVGVYMMNIIIDGVIITKKINKII